MRDMVFEGATATGTTGSLKLVRTTRSLIEGNAFVDGNDNLMVQESDRNTIVGNTFERGRHSLLSVRCSDANVFRGNTFSNPDQKAVEIYDCEGVSDAPVEYDATHRNLIEENRFILTLGSDAAHRYNGIQYAGQDGIVRQNIFHDNAGGGFNIQVYSDEALVNYGHRVYHNTLVDVGAFEYGATAPPGPDAGVDGGTTDGGARPDGGAGDSGGAVDGGPAADPEGGGGCNLGGVSSTRYGEGSAMLVVALALLRRRRRG